MTDILLSDHQAPAIALREAGIAAARAGQEFRARCYLQLSLALDPGVKEAWLGLANVGSTPQHHLSYLQQARATSGHNNQVLAVSHRAGQQSSSQRNRIQPLSTAAAQASTHTTAFLEVSSFARTPALGRSDQLPRLQVGLFLTVTYLLAVGLAEVVAVWGDLRAGLVFFGLILVSLFLNATFGREDQLRRLCLALALIPLNRIVSFSIPLGELHSLDRYLVATGLLVVAAGLVIYYLALRPGHVGLEPGKRPFALLVYFLVALAGFLFGLTEFLILKPPPPLVNPPTSVSIIAILLLITLLVLKELTSTVEGRWQVFGRFLNIAIVPLIPIFLIAVVIRIVDAVG